MQPISELNLVELQQHALQNLMQQITTSNARLELFSDFASTYTEVRSILHTLHRPDWVAQVQDALLRWTAENWKALEAAKAG